MKYEFFPSISQRRHLGGSTQGEHRHFDFGLTMSLSSCHGLFLAALKGLLHLCHVTLWVTWSRRSPTSLLCPLRRDEFAFAAMSLAAVPNLFGKQNNRDFQHSLGGVVDTAQ